MRIGISCLALSSALLIVGGAYAQYAAANPEGITFYASVMMVVRSRISVPEVIAFVFLEHLLVGGGIWSIVRTTRRVVHNEA